MNLGLLLSVGIGGFMGAIFRFSISSWVGKATTTVFPWGTLSVNVLGSFFIGFLFLYFQQVNFSPMQKSFFMIGLLGALTTFSTFSLETVLLMEKEFYVKAFSNMLLNVIFSIVSTLLGMFVFKYFYIKC
ncbi:MAG: CrcB protein [uncultured Sulfurovum sp.]|uniref:Fluoride-specific ion channel FluC n=1 Tax=uncultured Sulfurovum sp. TaxID=269237 RepID=A0A6S6SXQ0_9BACT|nr:MAG: CrcB protein [uncultured Sulfurovum sp.]